MAIECNEAGRVKRQMRMIIFAIILALAICAFLVVFKYVDHPLANNKNLLSAARDAAFQPGNYVTFGTYPQTSLGIDKTPIEWLVLARDGQNALLLSRYGLDVQRYHDVLEADATWEECTLRAWLNSTFMDKAFSSSEQSAILLTDVENNWWFVGPDGEPGKNDGNDTQDRVFLLSYPEADKYIGVTYNNSDNIKARVAPTAYAIERGAWTHYNNKTADGEDAGWWWLRTAGFAQDSAVLVTDDGFAGPDVIHHFGTLVRPALWVNVDSGVL